MKKDTTKLYGQIKIEFKIEVLESLNLIFEG